MKVDYRSFTFWVGVICGLAFMAVLLMTVIYIIVRSVA